MDLMLNWLWQGGLVAVALFGLLRLLDRAQANVRYVVCWAGLLLVIALPALSSVTATARGPEALARLSTDAIVSVPVSWWTSSAVLLAAWAVWAGVCAVRFVLAMAALRRARGRSRMFPSVVESSLPWWRRVRDEGRRPALVLSDAVTSAAVLGGGRPMIAVAPSLVATLDAAELDRVLIHEWAHVQRRDDLVGLLQVVLRIVAGWHPAVWWIERRLHVERELACDEMAVALTGSPKSYAECLVKLAALMGAERTVLQAPAALRASGLHTRVTRIVSRRSFIPPIWSRGIAAGVVSLLGVVSFAAGGQRLVGAAVLALPLDSIPDATIRFEAHAPGVVPAQTSRTEAPPVRSGVTAAPVLPPRPAPGEPPPSAPVFALPETPLPPEPSATADSLAPHRTAERAGDIATAPAAAAALALAPSPAAAPPEPVVVAVRSTWTAAADTGVAVGRTSKDAGVATAGFFSRVARRVAGTF